MNMAHSILGSATRANVTGVILLASSFALQAAPQPPPNVPASPTAATASTKEAAVFEAKAKYLATMAKYYRQRARAHPDDKHEITWLTLANRCDEEAEHYHRLAARLAAHATGSTPRR